MEGPPALARLLSGDHLDREEMEALVGRIMDGGVEPPLQAGLLVALAAKGETAAEVAGAASAMRARARQVPHHRPDVIDTCGTGGDGTGTFNISTAAALVTAAAGQPVAKHGNRSVSSRSGSADVLAELGVDIELGPEDAARALDEIGIAFLFAPAFHPAMREVMPVRQVLGVRTMFNVLGPLTNPAGARRQLMGVYAARLVELIADVLLELDCEHAWVVHGEDGLDEITTTGPTRVAEVREGEVRLFEIQPEDFGLPRSRPADLAGGDPRENAAIVRRVLAGEPGPAADIVALNAAAGLYVGGKVESLEEGVAAARRSLESGTALETLERLAGFEAEDG